MHVASQFDDDISSTATPATPPSASESSDDDDLFNKWPLRFSPSVVRSKLEVKIPEDDTLLVTLFALLMLLPADISFTV